MILYNQIQLKRRHLKARS